MTEKDAERFWGRVDKSEGCWGWTGPLGDAGYGQFKMGGKVHGAHRASLMLSGVDVPTGAVVRHSCDHPWCVRPEHLSVGTHAENQEDKVQKGRHAVGSNHGRAKLSNLTALHLRGLKGLIGTALASRLFGVDPAAVRAIWQERKWRHLLGQEVDAAYFFSEGPQSFQ